MADSQMGVGTALEDEKTHLQWMNLRSVAGQRWQVLQEEMQKDEELEGWRFATLDELRRMLSNFMGSAESGSLDLSKERAFQRVLGGPLNIYHNEETGWSRQATYGYLMPAEATACDDCDEFMVHSVYLGEDAQNGKATATLTIEERRALSNGVPGSGAMGAIFLVRNAR